MITLITLDDHTGTPITLHDVSGTSKRSAIAVNGLLGGYVSTLRDDKATLPQAHGGINNTRYTDGAAPSLTLEVMGTSQSDCEAQYEAMVAPMMQTLDYGPALLKWTESTGKQLQRLVKLDSDIDPPISGGAAILTFQVSFYAEDPRAYSQSLTTVSSSALASLLANPNFVSDTLTAAPAHWSVISGTFRTNEVLAYGDGTRYWRLNTLLTAAASAAVQSDKFAVTAGVSYALAVGLFVDLPASPNEADVSVLTYTSGGTLVGTHLIGTRSGPGGTTVICGTFTADATVTQAAVNITFKNEDTATDGLELQILQVVCSPTPSLTLTNNGIRDTPLLVTLSGATGQNELLLNGQALLELQNQPWMTYTAGTFTIDFAAKTIVEAGHTDIPNLPSDGSAASALLFLTPGAAIWANLPAGSSPFVVLGLLIGATMSVAFRDAY